TASSLTPAEVSGLASSIDAPVYVVATVPPIDFAAQAERGSMAARFSGDLRDLATWTGGDLLWVTAPEDAALQARSIVYELRHQYLIMIEPAADQAWRPIDVRVRDRKMTVRARSGYFGSRLGASRSKKAT